MDTTDTDSLVVLYWGPGFEQPELMAGQGVDVIAIDERVPGNTLVYRPAIGLPLEEMARMLEEAELGNVSLASLLTAIEAKAAAAGVTISFVLGETDNAQAA